MEPNADIRYSKVRKHQDLIPIVARYDEVFKDPNIPGTERIKISNYGRVYGKDCGMIILPYRERNGYLRVTTSSRHFSIHRLVLIAFNPIKGYEDLQVNHINGNKLDNSLVNLEWCTSSENVKHAFRTGLHKVTYGENATYSKYSNELVESVCKLMSNGIMDYHKICELIGVEYCEEYTNLFYNIKTHKAWSFISSKYGI